MLRSGDALKVEAIRYEVRSSLECEIKMMSKDPPSF